MIISKMSFKPALVIILFACVTQAATRLRVVEKIPHSKCQNKLMTSYSRMMLDAIRPTSTFEGTLSLQQRFIAGVHLYGGEIRGFQMIQPIEEPSRLFCFNDSIAALQTKFKIPDVEVSYGFAFTATTEVRGKLSLVKQDFFLDIDMEQDGDKNAPSLLGLYMTQPDDRFKFDFEQGSEHGDIEKIKAHVGAIAHTCFSRDSRTALQLAFVPKLEEFLESHSFSLE